MRCEHQTKLPVYPYVNRCSETRGKKGSSVAVLSWILAAPGVAQVNV
jgi:hypothetical protein